MSKLQTAHPWNTYLSTLVERLAANRGGNTEFSIADLNEWPTEFVEMLKSERLIQKSAYAQNIECRGCEINCFMPVYVDTIGDRSRAFIVCDQRDDIGRVKVEMQELERFKTHGDYLAHVLKNLLQLEGSQAKAVNSITWQIGNFKGTKRKSPLILSLEKQATLTIAGHTLDLLDVLSIREGRLSFDESKIIKLVDSPTGKVTLNDESLDAKSERIKARRQELQAQGRKGIVKQIAAEEGLSEQRIYQFLEHDPSSKTLENLFKPKANKKRD